MPAGRFVVPAGLVSAGADIELPGAIAYQVRDVLRRAVGGTLTLLDGSGGEWPATLTEVSRARVRARVGARRENAAEPSARVVLYQGMLKAAKFEWVLQKGTELGVATFVPLRCERAVTGAEDTGSAKRARWQRTLEEATEQCGRARVPELAEPAPLAEALASLTANSMALIPWEEERITALRAAITTAPHAHSGASQLRAQAPDVHLFIGPEGGFSAGEVALARRHGAVSVTLGPRILRAETAAIAAVALVMEALGELG
jgi:16S rRNA (uracil1498-N3)-methyltransferase